MLAMKVIDLCEEHRTLFACCLEDWSADAKEGAPRRERWIARHLALGLRAKLALNDEGTVGGMIQYLPIEHSFVQGRGLYFVPCIWVHGHKEGRGDFRGHGMGSALLEAAETDARERGAKGMAAWGLWLPFWMKASWYRKHGYRNADRQGMAQLVWKPFGEDAEPPRWFRPRKSLPVRQPGVVNVTAFTSGWCMAQNLTMERAERAAGELGNRVVYHEIDTSDRAVLEEWARPDELFVDGRAVRTGPPPSYEKLKNTLSKRIRRS
jgi:GNAT superfamily N-acetyltransferase